MSFEREVGLALLLAIRTASGLSGTRQFIHMDLESPTSLTRWRSPSGDVVKWRRVYFIRAQVRFSDRHPSCVLTRMDLHSYGAKVPTFWRPVALRAQLVTSCVRLSSRIGMYASYHFF